MGNKKLNIKTDSNTRKKPYPGFRQIDGSHPFKAAVPNGFVDYPVRSRHGGEVVYFNFDLAREMGLIADNHPQVLNAYLRRVILETFSLKIINEYDVIHKSKFPRKDIRPNRYMATRYLQAQHPDKKGLHSGDGRSIWNGCFVSHKSHRPVLWDISSCGTGATCLSPATAIEGQYFKTGDNTVSYGCGRSDLLEGVGAMITSEIFHRNAIPTERTLAIIGFNDKTSINIRASRNLLRPAHFFYHLKQNKYDGLKGAVDYYIDRQINNGDWPRMPKRVNRYQYLLERVATYFGKAAALFEMEYIFCWMDWDGDNILVDGGVIDYGSVRQFGLFHSEYRYEDVDRYSTSIAEQRNKARYIVQTFAQIADFLSTGTRKPIRKFSKDRSLRLFKQVYERTKDELILYKMGLDERQTRSLLNDSRSSSLIDEFRRECAYFEKAKSKKGPHKVADGVTWDAIFCLRDILRELPQLYSVNGAQSIPPEQFIAIIKSNYAVKKDLALYRSRVAKIRKFQSSYKKMLERVAALSDSSLDTVLKTLAHRSRLINRPERVTGDSLIHVSERLTKNWRRLTSSQFNHIVCAFIKQQVLRPEFFESPASSAQAPADKATRRMVEFMRKTVEDFREGI